MRRLMIVGLLSVGLVAMPVKESHAIIWKVVTAAVKKVVKAIDLQIQRQQNKVIWLQNAQKTLENTLSKLKLKEIGDWSEKQRNLYKGYFDELHKVKTLISYYQRVRDITNKQIRLVEEYKAAWRLLQRDRNFRPDEVAYMGRVYEGILGATVDNIDQLTLVIQSFTTSMSDAKRLDMIAAVDGHVDNNLDALRRFNRENALLSLERTKSQHEVNRVRSWYGIETKE